MASPPLCKVHASICASALNDSSRGSSSGGHHRLRSTLVVLEVALALLLLTGAGLLLQSFARLSQVNPGVQPERLFTAAITLSDAAYPKPEKVAVFQDQLLTRVRALPGVRDASTVFPLPLSGTNVSTSFDVQERPKPEGNRDTSPLRVAGSDYFRTMGVSLVRGRLFDQSDRLDSKPVIIINQRFAEKFFPSENPIGKRIQPGISLTDTDGPMREIIGVVTNVKHQSLRLDFTPEMYVSATQFPLGIFSLIVRTNTSQPAALTGSIRSVLGQIDPGVPLTRVKMFEDYISRSLARPRFNALLLSIFAGVRSAPDHDRHLRRDGLLGRATPSGNRHPHGARCTKGRCPAPGRGRRDAAHRTRRRHRRERDFCPNETARQPALRCQVVRPPDAWQRRLPLGCDRASGLLGAGAARQRRQSACRPA